MLLLSGQCIFSSDSTLVLSHTEKSCIVVFSITIGYPLFPDAPTVRLVYISYDSILILSHTEKSCIVVFSITIALVTFCF